MNSIVFAGQTDVGRHRRDNQDSFTSIPLWNDHTALLVVIDGVGGYAGGDRAAAIAKECIERYMQSPTGDTLTMLREAVVYANNQIAEQRRQDPRLAQMCCVLTAAVADARTRKAMYVHVGDTRMYRLRAGQLQKITRDHSMVGAREDANQLTEEQAMQHPRRNEVLRTVGSDMHRVDDPDFLESGETEFMPGDGLLLCSDGLTDMLPRAQMLNVLTRNLSLDEQVTELIRQANDQGGQDNITVVLARNTDQSAGQTINTQAAPVETNHKITPPVAAPLPPVAAAANTGKPGSRSPWGLWAGALALAGLVGTLFWYNSKDEADTPPPTADTTRTTSAPEAVPVAAEPMPTELDSLLRLARQSESHRLVWPKDTLRLTQPLLLSDSLRAIVGSNSNQRVVVMPADTTQTQPAFRIVGIKNALLENLVFTGYQTAVEADTATELRLRNVVFSGVETPIRAAIRRDTFRDATVRVMIQNQIDPPRKP